MRHLLLLACCCCALAADRDGFVPLFDGKTLDGWINPSGQGKAWVEDGEIRTLSEQHFFLLTQRRFGDFILEAEFLVPDGCNSGIQFRTQLEGGKVWGYQAEVDTSARRWTGGLYDQGRRAWLSPLEGKPEAQAAYRNNQWNRVRVECSRDRVRIFVNDVLTTDYIDSTDVEGHIGLQNHGRFNAEKPLVHRFRNIRIRDLGRRRWLPVWDGRTQRGWNARPAEAWRPESGILTGTGKPGSLLTKKSYSDFTVRLQFRLVRGDGAFRFGRFVVPLGAGEMMGGLSNAAGEPLVRPRAPSAKSSPAPDGWRMLAVSTHGRRIAVHLDGQLTADTLNAARLRSGRLGLTFAPAHPGSRLDIKSLEVLGQPERPLAETSKE